MKKSNNVLKRAAKSVVLRSAKIGCESASVHFFGQPKEPKNLKQILKKSK